MNQDDDERFDVWEFYPEDWHTKVASDLTLEQAVLKAKACTVKPAVHLGIITQVMITDEDDNCVFLWKHGEGVVFPNMHGQQ